jgi:mono/diheme cytochrome c family protein
MAGWFRGVKIVCAALGISLVAMPLLAEEFNRGKELYENHCKVCHESWAHERSGRQVTSREELRRRVQGWSLHSRLDWSDEDVNDVSDYLDRQYYRFTDQP